MSFFTLLKELPWPPKPTRKMKDILFNADSVLDVGCGDGWLKEYVPGKYTGVTYDLDGCKCKEDCVFINLEEEGIGRIKSNSYDVVYASHIIEHFTKPVVKKVMRHIHRITKKEGVCFIITPSTFHPFFYGSWDHVRPYDYNSLSQLLNDFGFQDVDWTYFWLEGTPKNFQKYFRYPLTFIPPLKVFLYSQICAWGVKK